MSTTNQIADALEKNGIPFTRVEGSAGGIEYWGLTVYHENICAEVRECADWVEMKVWHYTPEQFMNMLTGVGMCRNVSTTGNFRCSECDATDLDFDKPTYCHGCGRKVVTE